MRHLSYSRSRILPPALADGIVACGKGPLGDRWNRSVKGGLRRRDGTGWLGM